MDEGLLYNSIQFPHHRRRLLHANELHTVESRLDDTAGFGVVISIEKETEKINKHTLLNNINTTHKPTILIKTITIILIMIQ